MEKFELYLIRSVGYAPAADMHFFLSRWRYQMWFIFEGRNGEQVRRLNSAMAISPDRPKHSSSQLRLVSRADAKAKHEIIE